MKQVPSLEPLDDAQMALLVTFVGQRGDAGETFGPEAHDATH